jgi:Golgi nucleoside diphosphatase
MVFSTTPEDNQFNDANLNDANDISLFKNKINYDNKIYSQPIINRKKKKIPNKFKISRFR